MGTSLHLLKATELRALLQQIGSPSSGTKAALSSRLRTELMRPRITWTQHSNVARLLSIDMGVRNLAFCLIEVQRPLLSLHPKELQKSSITNLNIRVCAWRRITVPLHILMSDEASESDGSQSTLISSSTDIAESSLSTTAAFTPALLSQSALSLVNSTFLPLKPSTILIERQRFRSGGGPAVFEWTLRVNSLEGMIWAVLRTMQAQGQLNADAHEVSPSMVARYWCGDGVKVDKKEKIAIAARWLGTSQAPSPGVTLIFDPDAAITRDAFVRKLAGKRRSFSTSKGTSAPVRDVAKLDDLADCLLQAAAFYSWEINREAIAMQYTLNDG